MAPPSILIAQAIGITSSTFLFGANASIAVTAIPALLLAPAPLAARQWAKLYEGGKRVGLGCTVAAMGGLGWAAWNQDPTTLPYKLNLTATFILPCIVPFTLLVLKPINDQLFARATSLASDAKVAAENEESVHALMDRWTLGHVVRTGITGVGAVLAVWAALVERLE